MKIYYVPPLYFREILGQQEKAAGNVKYKSYIFIIILIIICILSSNMSSEQMDIYIENTEHIFCNNLDAAKYAAFI